MGPADGSARAQKRRRLHNIGTFDQAQYQKVEHWDSEENQDGSQSIREHEPQSNSVDLVDEWNDLTPALQQEVECCYGMLAGIPVVMQAASSVAHTNPTYSHVPVSFESENKLSPIDNSSSINFGFADLPSRLLSQLNAAVELSTQLYCLAIEIPGRERSGISGRQKGRAEQTWSLNVIIYGPIALEETIGDFLTSHGIYLQDPLACNRRVPYRNPHLFSVGPDEVMTDCFQALQPDVEIERLDAGPGLLAQFMEDEIPLEETEAPAIVTTKLFPHQKQALTFMIRHERGWNMDRAHRDIWSREMDTWGGVRYRNNISGDSRLEAPHRFPGGLLADDMGLGKTLGMIAVIATNQISQLPSPPITPEPFDCCCSFLYSISLNWLSVIFSFWTYTLDLVQLMLDYYSIRYTRIDGKTALAKRTEALQSFQDQDELRVILVSITCGGAGLDLTPASRVYLLEPHWNPMIEEQALCRVHRVGQQRPVTTIRYLMRDSFEEQVVEIQKRKRMLAQVTFGQSNLSEDGIGLGALQYLKSVLE